MAYKLIKSRSPFYVQFASNEAVVTCDLTVWTGTISSKPVTASYNLSKEPVSGQATFEIGELIRDFIAHTSTTAGRVWVEVVTGDGVASDVTNTYLATEGYTIFNEGLQHEGTLEVSQGYGLPTETSSASLRTYRVVCPEGISSTIPAFTYVGTNSGTDDTAGTIVDQPYTSVATQVTKSENGITHITYIDRFRCSKFDIAKITYINKAGGRANFFFTMKSKEMLSSSSDSFQRSLSDFGSLSANNGLHAHRKRILGAKQSFTLNTDYIAEYYTKQIEEIFLSEYVWLTVGSGDAVPVNIDDSSLEKKRHVNDMLIQYTFNVTTAANYLNTVR